MNTVNAPEELMDDAITTAVGEELRLVREARGLSRYQLVGMLPSGICERTLLAYEAGRRPLSLLRFAELSWALDVDAPTVFARGLQRARVFVERLTLAVNLRGLLRDERPQFRPLAQWARNTLNDRPNGIVEVEPAAVQNLAWFIGCKHQDLADHLARFTPDVEAYDQKAEEVSREDEQ